MKSNFLKKLGVKIVGLIGLTIIGSSLGGLTSHAVMDGVNYVDPSKIYDEANSLILSKNANIKNFTVETINADPQKKVNEKGSADIYRSFDKNYSSIRLTFGTNAKPTISKDSKIIVTQENVGSYNGKAINVKQIFSNFTLRSTYMGEESPYFEISENPFSGYLFVGFPTFKYDVEFSYADTGEKVSFSNGDAFLSFNSLNGATDPSVKLTNRFESVKYYNSDNKKDVYVTKDTNIGYGNPSKISVTNPDRASNTYNGDMYGGFSNDFTDYLGGATFSRNTAQFKLSGDTQSFQIGSNTGEAWNALSTATIFNVKMPTPVKTEQDSNGNDINGKTVDRDSTIIYKIHQKVNNLGVDILERYTAFNINDPLDKNVTYQSARVTDSDGKTIENFGTINYDNVTRITTASASKDFLTKMPLSAETYILEITAKVNSNVKNQTIIPNIGNVTINNQNEKTNEVKNTVLVPETIDPIKKEKNEEGIDYNGKDVSIGDVLTFDIDQKVNELGVDTNNRYSSFTIKDTLDNRLGYIADSAVILKDGKEMNDVKVLSFDETANRITFSGDSSFLKDMEMKGETYTLRFKAKVLENVKNGDVITNKAETIVNSVEKETNETKNPVKVPEIVDPVKKEKNEKGVNYDGKDVYVGDILVFDVEQKVNVLGTDISKKYSTFTIKDTLDNRLRYIADSAVILKDGKEMNDVKVLSFDETANKITFSGDSSFLKDMEMKGETYTLRFKAEVLENVGEGDIITNKAETIVNDVEKETNETKNPVKVPKGTIEINKKTNQLTGIRVSTDTEGDENNIVYEKAPQGGVTYELTVAEDIVEGNGNVKEKAGTSKGEQTTDYKLGKATFRNLDVGVYQVKEVGAPEGIQIDPNPFKVEVKPEKGETEFTVEQGHEDPLQEVVLNGIKEFEQEDGSFKAQSGATFGLFLKDEYKVNSNSNNEDTTDSTTKSTSESAVVEGEPLSDSSVETESSVEDSSSTATTESTENEINQTIPKDTLIAKMKVDENGSLSYKGVLIPNQRYYVKEIETSEKYQLLKDELTFIYQPVNNDPTANITLYAQGYVTEGVYIPYEDVEAIEVPTTEILSKSEKYTEPTEEQKESIKNTLITENSMKKSIKKSDGTLVDSYDILKDKEKITFLGVATLGNNNNPDDSIVLEDNLPKGLSYESMKVFDAKQQDITSKVTIDSKGQKLSVTINQDYAKTLKSTKLYWEVITTYNASADVSGKKLENEMILNVGDKKYNSKVTLQTPKEEVPEVEKILPQTGEDIAKWAIIGVLGMFVLGATFIYLERKDKKGMQ